MHTPTIRQPRTKPNLRLLELDALRGLAAMSVVIFHFSINIPGENLGWKFRYGVTGVDIFFMISGFVIFMSVSKVKRWQDFVLSRFARLYPAFWICVLITTVFYAIFQPKHLNLNLILANATMIPSYFGQEDLDGSYWTLTVELLFYFWILILFLLKKLERIEFIGFATLLIIAAFHEFSASYPQFYSFAVTKIQLLNHFSLFYSGILFYQFKFHRNSFTHILLIVFSLFISFYLHDKGGRTQYHISATEHYLIITFFHFIFALFVTAKLTVLKATPLIFLGKISYCLYLIHQYVGLRLIFVFTEVLHFNVYVAIVLALGITVLLAYFIHVFVEIPANELIRNWYKNRRSERLHAERTIA